MLLPLVNVPMIDYTLEWLATAGVEEVHIPTSSTTWLLSAHSQGSTARRQMTRSPPSGDPSGSFDLCRTRLVDTKRRAQQPQLHALCIVLRWRECGVSTFTSCLQLQAKGFPLRSRRLAGSSPERCARWARRRAAR
jgi:hypothetical protein